MPSQKKPALGRGLGSLMGEAQSETGYSAQTNDTTIAIEMIEPNPDQPRTHFNETELEELADSIKEHGILQPLILREKGDKYEIIAGERRYQAAKIAGLTEVPAIIRDVDDETMLELALIENLQRTDLNPIEEAKGYKQLKDASGMTQEELAKTVSKSRSSITNSLRLLDLPEEVQQMLYDGKLTAGHARAILAVPDDDQRVKLAERVVEEGLSVRATENLAPQYSVENEPKTTRTPAPSSFKRVSRELRRKLDANVRVHTVRGKNKIEIEFKDEEDLARIVGKIIPGEEGQEQA